MRIKEQETRLTLQEHDDDDINREMQELEQGKTYNYLGIGESEGIQHQQTKERLKQEYIRRLRMILKSELNARNKITATGTLTVPILRYIFCIINWRTEEIKKKLAGKL